MSAAVVTGSGGLVGSEAVRFLIARGLDVFGIDNNMRAHFFGNDASTQWQVEELKKSHTRYQHSDFDIRNYEATEKLIKRIGENTKLIVHAAAQPSHDWAAREPFTDFGINAQGTLNLLEAVRRHAQSAVFVFLSTNKVYGDAANRLPLVEMTTRYEIDTAHRFYERGIDESMTIDQSMHSLFGASKMAADILVQEYGSYFGLRTGCFRCGCLSGPAHSGARLHGFLAYLMKCTASGAPYEILGYKGKQVRDNMHSSDLVRAIWEFTTDPKSSAVYNLGGGRKSNCSILEAIDMCEEIAERKLDWRYNHESRLGDHIWWISDTSHFESDYPHWELSQTIRSTLEDIYYHGRSRW